MSIFKSKKEFEAYKSSIRAFVRDELEPIAEQIEKTHKLPKDLQAKLAEKDLLKMRVPEKYGGMGLNYEEYLSVLEIAAQSHGSIRILVHGWGSSTKLAMMGTKAQVDKYLPLMAKRQFFPGFALTEPETGTGVDIKTTATKEGDHFVLNGKKHLISFGDWADAFVTIAYTDKTLGGRGMTAFLVDREAPGLLIEPMPEFMGLNGSYHGYLTFKNCAVSAENVFGKVGHGLDIALGNLILSRLGIAASCLGVAQRLLDLSVDFSKKRVTFGKPICERQGIREMLADMAIDVHCLRTITMDCARKADQGEDVTAEASMCKLYGIEAVRRVSDKAFEVHGGLGYTKVYPVERLYRDGRGMWFEEGTPSIHRLLIARDLLSK